MKIIQVALLCTVAVLTACAAPMQKPGKPEFMVVGLDNKATWDGDGKLQMTAPGKDLVAIVDIGTDPANPKVVTTLPLANSIFGPPTNLAITPNGQLALVANSVDWVADGPGWKSAPENKLYVIDLTTSPPRLIDTVTVGRQPSGMSINRAGDLALIANRADNSVSVLSITGKQVKLVENVVIGEHVAHVAFTPDGKRALAGKFPGHKVAMLEVNGAEGDLLEARPHGRAVAIQPRHHARRQARTDSRQRQQRQLRRPHRHCFGDRPRGHARARDRQGGGRRRPGGHRASARPAGLRWPSAARVQQLPRALSSTTATAASWCSRSTARRSPRSARSKCADCRRAPSSARTDAGCTSATSSTATSRCCVSTATPSPIRERSCSCRDGRRRCGEERSNSWFLEAAAGYRYPAACSSNSSA